MIDHQELLETAGIENLTAELKKFLNETRSGLKGCERRKFTAKVVLLMGRGGQLRVEHELGKIRDGYWYIGISQPDSLSLFSLTILSPRFAD